MKYDCVYFGAGYPVLRSKIFQVRGYDATIKPVAEPDFDPTLHSTIQGVNQEICSLKIPYITNQEGFHHEPNVHGF